jgi:predicted aspartyl protease
MPEVFVSAKLSYKDNETIVELLLNTGGMEVGLAVPKSLAKKLGVEPERKTKVHFGGVEHEVGVSSIEVTVEDPETGEERTKELETIVFPDVVLDRPLLGVMGLENLRIIPDVVTGKPLFKTP